MKLPTLSFFLIFSFLGAALLAQNEPAASSENPSSSLVDLLDQMKEGALIIRIPTNAKKMAAIVEMMGQSNLSEAQRERLEAQLQSTQEATEAMYQDIRKSFNTFYQWSAAIYYLPDYAVTDFLEGAQAGQFLNEKMEQDPSIVLQESAYWFGVVNNPTDPTGSIYKSIIVKDENWETLPAPFPHTKENLGTKLRIVFTLAEEVGEWAPLADKFQQRLEKIYAKSLKE